MYWHAPPLDQMRPELEVILKQQLHLRQLHLGHLSWYWVGQTWLLAEDVTFTTQDNRISAKNANLAVRLSTWAMLTGQLTPVSINLHRGAVSLHIPAQFRTAWFVPPSTRINLEDVSLDIRYNELATRLDHLNLHLDGLQRRLSVRIPGSNLDLSWNAANEPLTLKVRFRNLHWLPEQWRMRMRGAVGGELALQKTRAENTWRMQLALSASEGAQISGKVDQPWLGFDNVKAIGLLHTGKDIWEVARLEWEKLEWRSGVNKLQMAGNWQNGTLRLHMRSGAVHLPALASWLKPLGDEAWQNWLTAVDRGDADHIEGDLEVAQSSPWRIPDLGQWEKGRIRIRARLHDATIPLSSADRLQHLEASVDMDEQGLKMQVSRVELPHQAGVIHGKLIIHDWRQMVFDIQGGGKVDISRYQAWRGTGVLPQLVWRASPATARFVFVQMPTQRKGGHRRAYSDAFLAIRGVRPASQSDRWQAQMECKRNHQPGIHPFSARITFGNTEPVIE